VYKEQIELMNFLCACRSTYLVHITSYFCYLWLWWPNHFVHVLYSCHVLRHFHWTMPSPYCTMYVEPNEGI